MSSSDTTLTFYLCVVSGTIIAVIIALFFYFALRTFWLADGELVKVREITVEEGEDEMLLEDELRV